MESDRLGFLRRTSVAIEGVKYSVCGEFSALAEAEAFFNFVGHDINLAGVICNTAKNAASALSMVRQLFPCALHTFHPDVSYEGAQELIDRMTARDEPGIVEAVCTRMWPVVTRETDAANRNLVFDLESLAEANSFFVGETGLARLCVEGPFTVDYLRRVFACAVHQYQPELNLSEALQLMTLPSVISVIGGLGRVWRAASEETKRKFVERVMAAAAEEGKQDFRVLTKKPWPRCDRSVRSADLSENRVTRLRSRVGLAHGTHPLFGGRGGWMSASTVRGG